MLVPDTIHHVVGIRAADKVISIRNANHSWNECIAKVVKKLFYLTDICSMIGNKALSPGRVGAPCGSFLGSSDKPPLA